VRSLKDARNYLILPPYQQNNFVWMAQGLHFFGACISFLQERKSKKKG
jgi:hypothetical protein